MHKPLWMWGLFLFIVLALLVLDLGVFHKKEHEIEIKESLIMSGFYILMAFLFGGWVWFELGSGSFTEYLTVYLIEKSLSLDNIFVISLIFSSLSIPKKNQHRVLFWGIMGVIIMRAVMIALGAKLISHFNWVLYLFSAFMIITGVKMFYMPDHKMDIKNNPILIWMRKHLKITNKLHGKKFLVRKKMSTSSKTQLFITPLLVALILIEFMDLIFAIDSVPAVFTITTDAYIVYTSNIFAILGLRALYFALASLIDRFYYLKYSLAMILIFIGSKIFFPHIFNINKIPSVISLFVTSGLILLGCLYSIYKLKNKPRI